MEETSNKSSNITVGSAINKCQQKAYNTIASYRSAISEIYNYSDSYPIERHSDIVKFMIAIRKSNPSPSSPNDPIDIILALDFIISLASNEDIKIKLGTLQKTSYGISFSVINPKETNILISNGGNKSVSKKIFINYYENTELCPASAVLKLLERTQEWRTFVNQHEHLLLTTTLLYQQAIVDTISCWLRSILTQADPFAKAKDVRSISASLAQDAEADVSMILALGNWSNYSVYQRFYQRGIRKMLEHNKISSKILTQAKNTLLSNQVSEVYT
ncbi:41302_t:CDS:2 [Gigaspora margarita]|uniref:41302_t:CDS:1 n=1 Tax=Gigaspora margarita TaxID=4874 RepID=A0ABN7W9F7_GIGMA|nr:41302_t:CDS:2 [Gigaspora margarita]